MKIKGMCMNVINKKTVSQRKKIQRNVTLALLLTGLTSIAYAADISSSAGPVQNSTKIMERCADIAKSIHAIPAPAGQVEAMLAEHHNQVMNKDHAEAAAKKSPEAKPKEMDAAHLKTISPEQKAFADIMRSKRSELKKCGEEHTKVHNEALALAKSMFATLSGVKQPTEDSKKAEAILVSFSSAGENLSKEIASISNSSIHQMYISRTIRKNFLNHDISE